MKKAFLILAVLVAILVFYGLGRAHEVNKSKSYQLPVDEQTTLAQWRLTLRAQLSALASQTSVRNLARRDDALLARLGLIANAEQSIDLQYYIFAEDEVGHLLSFALWQAAERGVRVRMLLDDMQKRSDDTLLKLAAHPNIEVRLFNPLGSRVLGSIALLADVGSLNRRMHNKALIVDGVGAVVGGRNIGDEYLLPEAEVEFGDYDLLVIGEVVPQIGAQFDQYWNSASAQPVSHVLGREWQLQTPRVQAWVGQLSEHYSAHTYWLLAQDWLDTLALNSWHQGLAALFFDDPAKIDNPQATEQRILDQIGQAMLQANQRILLVSPYFIPTQSGVDALIAAKSRGLDITIVTNSLSSNNVLQVHGWYAKYRHALLKAGILLWEVKGTQHDEQLDLLLKTSLHAKTFVLDHRHVFVGSFNFDPRSAYLNTELGIMIDAPALAQQIEQQVARLLPATAYQLTLNEQEQIRWQDHQNQITYSQEPETALWRRWGAKIYGWMPVESLL
ncbi:Cardiolipin synthase C [Vibrio stylophorae]|uniref:Cardiolipin synthase C n=1 Tax=Vibrio stylophorae TaxID=659351 RepID=A0ABN8DR05_9VIBR|nr:phospholipase D family protein [Vibrio stylophorae]CAH0532609.1 Cardiolipin synthase C [Vibrio stylophorae]